MEYGNERGVCGSELFSGWYENKDIIRKIDGETMVVNIGESGGGKSSR